MKKMTLVQVAALVATTGLISAAVAQTTPAPADAGKSASVTATTSAAVNPPPAVSTSQALKEAEAPTSASNFSGGVALLNSAAYYDKEAADGKRLSNVIYLNAGYKFSPDWKLTLSQRFLYDVYNKSEAQDSAKVIDLDLRFNLTQSNLKLFGSEGAILYRLAPATTETSRNNARNVAYLLVAPSFTWKTGSAFEIGYDFAYQTRVYGSAIARNPATAVETDNGTAFRRQWHAVSNSGVVTYNIGDTFNVYQRIGHTMQGANRTKSTGAEDVARTGFAPHGHWADIETGLNLAASKQISFNLYASQGHPLTQSADLAGLYNDSTQVQSFMPFRPEQTSYELITSMSF